MNVALAALVFTPALAFGSFVNVVAARVPLRQSVSSPGSACMGCGTPIAPRDNIPIVSYLLLRGRCRHCGEPISAVYPAVEALTAGLVVACALAFGATAYTILASFFVIVLVTLSAADLRYRLVPNRIVLPAAVICLVGMTILEPSPEWVIAAIGASGFLLAAALAYPKGMGMGDVKLALLLGAMLGVNVTVALMVGFIAALVPAAVMALRHGSSARKMAIPFAPFLALGGVVALLFGDALLDSYLGIFG
jgi:leader peptidase (prepilin peptidase) / N-methyltransferase